MTVKQKQCLLTFLGYDTGGVDGIWGKKSQNALECCQEDLDIPASGHWNQETENAVLEAVYTYDDGPVEEDEADISVGDKSTPTGNFWDEIEFFTPEEMKCKCGGKYCDGYPHEIQPLLMQILDRARRWSGHPIKVISGLRCEKWNSIQGGVANSQHMYGEAMDIRIDGVSASELLAWMKKQTEVRYCYAINSTNVHFDIPKGKR